MRTSHLVRARDECREEELLDRVVAEVARAQPNLARGWFARLGSEELDGGVFRVLVENAAQSTYLQRECLFAFVAAVQTITGRLVSVVFDVRAVTNAVASELEADPPPDLTFDNFVVAPCNHFAHAAAVAVCDAPGSTYNPLFVHGGRGVGKTHLLRATAGLLGSRLNGEVICSSGSGWTAEFVRGLEDGSAESFRRRHRSAAALVLDDVHVLAGRLQSLDELFHAANDLLASGRQVVFASDVPPQDLSQFPERLLSRFQAGLVAAIDRPCPETLCAIAREKAQSRAIELPDSVVTCLAKGAGGSCSRLVEAIARLDALSRKERAPMTEALACRALDLCCDSQTEDESAFSIRP